MQSLSQLLSLSDTALPVGGLAHSFGLETLTSSGSVQVENLPAFLDAWCKDSLAFEAGFLLKAMRLCREDANVDALRQLNAELSAFKLARESRIGSIRMGMRLFQLFLSLDLCSEEQRHFLGAIAQDGLHYSVVFGVVANILLIDEAAAVTGYLNQSVAALISASQRLLPLGQVRAARILWDLKPKLSAIVSEVLNKELVELSSFFPSLEIASMNHPYLHTRLFLS